MSSVIVATDFEMVIETEFDESKESLRRDLRVSNEIDEIKGNGIGKYETEARTEGRKKKRRDRKNERE